MSVEYCIPFPGADGTFCVQFSRIHPMRRDQWHIQQIAEARHIEFVKGRSLVRGLRKSMFLRRYFGPKQQQDSLQSR